MQKFTQKIVQMMKDENLFESQGGPIILSQVWFSIILLYNSGFQESYKSQRSPTSYSLNLLFLILLDFFSAD
jgi:hypothetical protein